ncbi:hypothetical protein ACGF07_23455 [Kitasatospora sp. NPDC048194]
MERGPEPCLWCKHARHLHLDRACEECGCGEPDEPPVWERTYY